MSWSFAPIEAERENILEEVGKAFDAFQANLEGDAAVKQLLQQRLAKDAVDLLLPGCRGSRRRASG